MSVERRSTEVATDRKAARRRSASRRPRTGHPGLAVDFDGGPVVDPTENVIALTEAAVERQDDLREMNNRRIDAEMKHVEAVATLRSDHAKEIRQLESDRIDKIRQVDVLAGNTAADRALVAIQTLAASQAAAAETLRSMVTSTATTIATQTATAMAAVTERIAALEKAAYKGEGKEAVADPMIAQLLGEMKHMRDSQAGSAGKSQGVQAVWAILGSAVALIVGLITIGTFVFITTRQQPTQAPTIYVPSPTGTMLPSTPPAQVPR